MKLHLDVPTIIVAVSINFLLTQVSIPSGWLLNYDGLSMSWFIIGFFMLVASGIWLIFSRHLIPSGLAFSINWFRGNGFNLGQSRIQTPWSFDLPRHPEIDKPAKRPVEWIRSSLNDISGRSCDDVVRDLLTAQLTAKPVRDLLTAQSVPKNMITALILAVRASRRTELFGVSEIDRLSASAWDALRKGTAPDFGMIVSEILARFPDLRASSPIAVQHYFPSTRLLGEIDAARLEGHIVPASVFRWVKAFDRSLFYAINNLGRSSMFVEGAGISSHYAAECHVGGAMMKPQIDVALYRVRKYLVEQKFTSDAQWATAR